MLLVHFVAMIALVGGAAAISVVLALTARGEAAERAAHGRAVDRMNRWLLLPGLVLAPLAGLWLWSRHHWVFPAWLQYKLGLTLLGLLGTVMYLHLFRRELRPLLDRGVAPEDGALEATASCRRIVGAAGALLLAAAMVGTLKPGW